MTDTKKALEMAIEALEDAQKCLMGHLFLEKLPYVEAIQACKEALEPKIELADTISVEDYQKLREQPVVKESLTVQEPVRRQCIVCETEYDDGIPPKVKQPTQPLEIEIINNLYDMAHERDGDAFDFDHTKFARSIEQAHGIVETKND